MNINSTLNDELECQLGIKKELYLINNLKNMQVIELNTGKILGYINDLVIDCDEYKIKSIILPVEKNAWFKKSEFLEIPWDKIYRLGVDVILVSLELANIQAQVKNKEIIIKNDDNLL